MKYVIIVTLALLMLQCSDPVAPPEQDSISIQYYWTERTHYGCVFVIKLYDFNKNNDIIDSYLYADVSGTINDTLILMDNLILDISSPDTIVAQKYVSEYLYVMYGGVIAFKLSINNWFFVDTFIALGTNGITNIIINP